MKFFGANSFSSYLFYTSRICAVGGIVLTVFILLSLAFGNFSVVDDQFQISVPFFSELYIKGFHTQNTIISITAILLYSSLFFYALSLILKSFKSDKLFTEKAIRQLNFFSILNLVAFPILYLFIHFVLVKKSTYSGIHNLILSIILGLFVLFIAAIFKRGVKVQRENDLTI